MEPGWRVFFPCRQTCSLFPEASSAPDHCRLSRGLLLHSLLYFPLPHVTDPTDSRSRCDLSRHCSLSGSLHPQSIDMPSNGTEATEPLVARPLSHLIAAWIVFFVLTVEISASGVRTLFSAADVAALGASPGLLWGRFPVAISPISRLVQSRSA